MELKRRLGLAAELGLVMITLPLLLLGCGGGGSSGSSSSTSLGMMTGQFWTDLTGAGIREFWPGSRPPLNFVNSPAGANINTATFSGGSYTITDQIRSISGAVWTTVPDTTYYLGSSGWTITPSPWTITATNPSAFTIADINLGSATVTISTTNLSGSTIAASSMVPAIDPLGYASSVSPASATYPANSYGYTLSELDTSTTPAYWLYATSDYEVTTAASSPAPINQANFTAAGFALHTSTADPICLWGYGLVNKTGTTYDFYALTLNTGVPTGTMPTCQTASITTSSLGTYDLSFAPIMGTTVVTFSHPTGFFSATVDLFGKSVVGVLSTFDKAYLGSITPAGTTTVTTYWLNKAAMDAAMNAWGATPP